jgi:hypothetical protein
MKGDSMWKWISVALVLLVATPSYAQLTPIFKPVHVFQDAAGATGNGTALQVQGWATIGVQVVITDTATVTFESTVDDSNWASSVCTSVASTSGALVTTATTSGVYFCNVSGMTQFRVRVSSFTGGTITAKGLLTLAKRGGSGGGGSSSASSVSNSDTLPATCTQGDVYHDNDATSGSRFFYCNATDSWLAVLTAEAQGLQEVVTVDPVVTSANSSANGVCIGSSSTDCVNIYWDAALGGQVRPKVDADTKTVIPTNFNWCLYDIEATSCILTVNPDAASTLDMYTFASAYRPKKSVLLTADAFYMKSGCTLTTDSALITAGLTEPYITCTDNDASGFHRTMAMPDAWDGGTVTFKLYLTNVNAAPANDYQLDLSAECEANSEVIGTSISGTGEVAALVDFDNSGTCSTACAQFDLATVTTSAHTVNGTCAGGNLFRINALVNATNTTTAQVADVKIIALRMEYSVSSLSD